MECVFFFCSALSLCFIESSGVLCFIGRITLPAYTVMRIDSARSGPLSCVRLCVCVCGREREVQQIWTEYGSVLPPFFRTSTFKFSLCFVRLTYRHQRVNGLHFSFATTILHLLYKYVSLTGNLNLVCLWFVVSKPKFCSAYPPSVHLAPLPTQSITCGSVSHHICAHKQKYSYLMRYIAYYCTEKNPLRKHIIPGFRLRLENTRVTTLPFCNVCFPSRVKNAPIGISVPCMTLTNHRTTQPWVIPVYIAIAVQ